MKTFLFVVFMFSVSEFSSAQNINESKLRPYYPSIVINKNLKPNVIKDIETLSSKSKWVEIHYTEQKWIPKKEFKFLKRISLEGKSLFKNLNEFELEAIVSQLEIGQIVQLRSPKKYDPIADGIFTSLQNIDDFGELREKLHLQNQFSKFPNHNGYIVAIVEEDYSLGVKTTEQKLFLTKENISKKLARLLKKSTKSQEWIFIKKIVKSHSSPLRLIMKHPGKLALSSLLGLLSYSAFSNGIDYQYKDLAKTAHERRFVKYEKVPAEKTRKTVKKGKEK